MRLMGGGATATTDTVDTTGCTAVRWRFGGLRDAPAPGAGEYLWLEYFDGTDWVEADEWEGDDAGADDAFSIRHGTLSDARALHSSFRVRLVSSGSGPGVDLFCAPASWLKATRDNTSVS